MRCLEIGPGRHRLDGFETLDVVDRPGIDHVADALATGLPSESFDLVYASHVIEHVPWYQTGELLAEWRRILKPGGQLEVWTVDAAKVMRALVHYEDTGEWTGPTIGPGSWKHEWIQGDPYQFCQGRTFCYSKSGRIDDPFWHRAFFTPRSLARAFASAGLVAPTILPRTAVRGKDHGWVNLGMSAIRPC